MKGPNLQIKVNGEIRQLDKRTTVEGVLSNLKITQLDGLAVAVNENVISKTDYRKTELTDGDTIEIIRATQGG